jgi:P4 family phage/plasmid primase-like protien
MKNQTSAPLPRNPRRGQVVKSGDGPPVFVSNADLYDEEIKKNEDRALRQSIIEEQGEPVFYYMKEGQPVSVKAVKPAFFAALYGKQNNLIWEEEEKRFYRYQASTGLWLVEEEPAILSGVHGFMLNESRSDELAKGVPTMNLQEKLCLKAEQEIILRMKGNVGVKGVFERKEKFMKGERFIHFANGVKVIKEGKLVEGLEPFDKRFFSRGRCPVKYDPSADCPRFRAWLRGALEPIEADADTDALLTFIGMCLIGHNVFQKIALLHGEAGSGKSSFLKMVQLLIGEDNSTEFDSLAVVNDRFAMSNFIGKWLLFASDVDSKFLLRSGTSSLKRLTGGDTVNARLIYGGNVGINGTLNCIVTMNAREPKIKLDDDAGAWQRRLVVIPFICKPAQEIGEFASLMIDEEGTGIVNQALLAVFSCLESGSGFPMSETQRKRVKDMLGRSDTVCEFLLDRVEIEKGEELIKSSLVREYKDYCKVRHWSVGSDREIGGKLKALMEEKFNVSESHSIEDHRGLSVTGYRGVKLRD